MGSVTWVMVPSPQSMTASTVPASPRLMVVPGPRVVSQVVTNAAGSNATPSQAAPPQMGRGAIQASAPVSKSAGSWGICATHQPERSASNDEAPRNIPDMSVTAEVSSGGIEVSEVANTNIWAMSVTEEVSSGGIEVSEVANRNIWDMSVTEEVSSGEIEVSEVASPNIWVMLVTEEVSSAGMVVSELAPANIWVMSVTDEVSSVGIVVSWIAPSSIRLMSVTFPVPALSAGRRLRFSAPWNAPASEVNPVSPHWFTLMSLAAAGSESSPSNSADLYADTCPVTETV